MRTSASIGTGVMEEIWHGEAYTLPFLYLGSWRSIMFPETGRDIPFQIVNYAYVDSRVAPNGGLGAAVGRAAFLRRTDGILVPDAILRRGRSLRMVR